MNASPRTPATASFVDVLAMLPVIPTTSGRDRRRQAAATAWSARRAMVRDPDDGHVAEGVLLRLAGRLAALG